MEASPSVKIFKFCKLIRLRLTLAGLPSAVVLRCASVALPGLHSSISLSLCAIARVFFDCASILSNIRFRVHINPNSAELTTESTENQLFNFNEDPNLLCNIQVTRRHSCESF